jgi:hypothetical protein
LTTVEKIATTLGEADQTPLAELERLVNVLGEERALTMLDEALKVEAEGGMLTDDGTRRRTLGGVFFKLVKSQTTSKERGKIFGARQSAPPVPPITWDESKDISNEALKSPQGEVFVVKITVIGRPGRIIEKNNVVITSMQNSKMPNLPKGLPKPPADPTVYVIYMAGKQWEKVKDSIAKNSADELIIEGFPMFDKRIGQSGAMTIYAQNVTSKLLQQARREAQKAVPKGPR